MSVLGPALTDSPNEAGPATTAPARSGTGLGGRWAAWLAQPGNRAALAQTGITLLQGPAFGESTAGAVGRAIGTGFEAKDRALTSRNDRVKATQDAEIARQEQERANADEARKAAAAPGERALTAAQADYYTAGRGSLTAAQDLKGFSDWFKIAHPEAADPYSPGYTEPTPEEMVQYGEEYKAYKTALGGKAAGAVTPGTAAGPPALVDGQTGTTPDGKKWIVRGGVWTQAS